MMYKKNIKNKYQMMIFFKLGFLEWEGLAF